MSNEIITAEELRTKLDEMNSPNEREKMLMGEWVVAPEPRDYPITTQFNIIGNAGEISQDMVRDNVGMNISFSYENIKQLAELIKLKEEQGELLLPNDEVILNVDISMRNQYARMTGLCTPYRNPITGYGYERS